jgi:hypothetical protein
MVYKGLPAVSVAKNILCLSQVAIDFFLAYMYLGTAVSLSVYIIYRAL